MVIGVTVATCRIGDLFTAPTGGELIAGGTLDRSAPVGSKALVLGKIPVDNTGKGVLAWEAKILGSNSWLSIQNPGGSSKTDSVRVMLDPAGLDTGIYEDSISITSDVGGTGTVHVNWHIVDCDVKPIQSAGEEKSDTLTGADCGARHQTGTQAQFYGFIGNQGDIATVLLSSGTFNGFVALDTSLKPTVAPLDTATQCLGDTKNPCIYYFQLPSNAPYYIEVSGATAADTGVFDIRLISGSGRDPNSVQSLEQRMLPDSSQIVAIGDPVGANVLVHGVVSDSDVVDSMRLQAEWAPVGTPLQGVVMNTGPYAKNGQVASVTLGPLLDDSAYHWQVRAIDQRNNVRAQWDSLQRGSSPDFTVQIGHTPSSPTNLVQLQSDGSTVINTGGYASTTTVKFRGQVSDQDVGDVLHLEVEVEPIGTDTTGTVTQPQTFTTASTGGTSIATVIAPAIQDQTSYHWIARTVDQGGRHSGWVSFGNNAEITATDFRDSVQNTFNLVFTTQPPSSVTAGVAMPTVVVTAQNELGQTITSFTGSVTMSASGPGTLTGTTSVNAVAGQAQFNNLILTKAGSYTLLATSGLTNSQPSTPVTVNAAPVTQLVFTQPPTNATAGAPFSPTIQVSGEDQFQNVNPSYGGTVTLTIANNGGNPSPGTLRGTTSVPANSGTALFPGVNIDKIGSGYTLRAGASGVTPDTSGTFTITAAPVTHLVFTGQPSTTAAGQVIVPPVLVAGRDSMENTVPSFISNVTVALTVPAGATLGGPKTVAAVAGTAQFSALTVDKVGAYTLTATSGALPSAQSASFSIITSTVDSTKSSVSPNPLSITACASGCTAGGGTASTISIIVHDGSDNPVSGANVSLSAVGAGVISFTQPAPTDATGHTSGTMWSDSVGPKVVTAVANGIGIASHPTVTVNPGAAASLAFLIQPSNTGAGAAINNGTGVVVLAKDQFGNTATSYNGITVTMSPIGVAFAPTSVNTATASAGQAAFAGLRIYQAGTGYQMQASGGGLTSPLSNPFNITVGPAVRDTFTFQPLTTPVLARIDSAQGGVKVSVTDSVGNIVTADNSHQITMLFSGPGGASLGGTNPRPLVNGTATFLDLTLNKLGTYTLTAVSNLPGNPSDISASFNIIPGPAKTLGFKVGPSTVIAGQAITPAVQVVALDAAGDTATGFTGNVTIALNPSSGNLGGTVTVAAVSGIATFSNLTVAVAGNYTLTASATGVTSGTSNSFTVQPGGVSAINSTIGRSPTSITACKTGCTPGASTASTITVTAKDALGNPLAGKTVVLTSNGTGDAITQPASVTDVNGVAQGTISDTVTEAVTVSATISGVLINSTALVTVTAASPAVLLYITQPRDTTAGSFLRAPTGVQVRVQDQFHNNIPGNTSLVTLSILIPPSPNNGATLSGTLSKNAVNDVASFTNLSIDKVGGPYFLLAQSAGLTSDTSSQFSITAGNVSASQSTVAAAPTTITACSTSCTTGGSTATLITVTAKDGLGNGVAGASVTLTVSGSGNTTSPVSLIQTANGSGVATWTLNSTVAEGKTISASANSVGINQTASVTVNPAVVSASHSTVSANPTSISACASSCSTGAGTASLITVTAKDQFDNPVPSASVTLAVSGSLNTTNPVGATQTANGSGVATWTLNSTFPETKTISATANSVGITQTATVTVGTTGVSASQSTVSASLATITACQTSCTTGGGTATQITVTAKDQFGNGVGGASVTIAISGTGGNTTSPVSLTQTANGSGVATWTLNSTIAESKTITATANAVAITDNAVVTVNPGAVSAAQSTVTTAQATDSACSTSCTTGAGRASLITITAKDQFGNLIQGATVSMTGSPGTGNNFTAPPNTNSSGVSTSTFNSTKAEAKTISATVGGVVVTETAAVTVIPAGVNAGTSTLSAGQSSMTACAASCTTGGGTASLITVTAKDAFSNLIQNAKVVLSSTGSANSGLASPPNTNGSGVSQATFSSTKAEGKTVSGTLQVGSGTIVTITQTAGVTVNPDVADHLTFTTEPTTTNQNATINPPIVVTAFDQFGNVATGYTASVTLTITSGTGTGGAALNGTNPVSAIAGVATFTGMSIDTAGSQYSLDASDGSLTTTSSLFDIN